MSFTFTCQGGSRNAACVNLLCVWRLLSYECRTAQDMYISLFVHVMNGVTVLLLLLDLKHTVTKLVAYLHLICAVPSLRDFVERASCMNTCHRKVL